MTYSKFHNFKYKQYWTEFDLITDACEHTYVTDVDYYGYEYTGQIDTNGNRSGVGKSIMED